MEKYPEELEMTNYLQIPLCKSIEQFVNFNINDVKIIATCGQISLEEYVHTCIDIYKQIDKEFLKEKCNFVYNEIINKNLGDIFTNNNNSSIKWEF